MVASRNQTHRQILATRRGATVVEFSLVLPILLTFFIGVIEFTRLSNMRHAADNAAYEAARAVVVPGASKADAIAMANDLLARAGFSGATLVVEPSTIVETTESVTVRVDVPLSANSWLPGLLTGDYQVSRESTLMTERVPVIQIAAVPTPPPPPPPPPPADDGDDDDSENGGSWNNSGGNRGNPDGGTSSGGNFSGSTANGGSSSGGNGGSSGGSTGGSRGGSTAPPPPLL